MSLSSRTTPRTWHMLLVLAASAGAQSLVPQGASRAAPPTPAQVAPPAPKAPKAPAAPVPPAAPRARKTLEVGDPAPKLTDLAWLMGEPVKDWVHGTTYVVEFWAPWCPWCREALPLYADLSKKYAQRNVKVVAVAVWPKKNAPTMLQEFLAESEDAFPYPLAEDIENRTAKAWLDAADVLIPSAFIVDGSGNIAWIGDPRQGLDKALSKQIGWQEDTGFGPVRMARLPYEADIEVARAARLRGDWKAAAEKSKSNYEKNTILLADEAIYYYISLVMLGEKDTARTWGERLLNVDFAGKFNGLNSLAWYVVDPKGDLPTEKMDLDLALRAATRADELTDHKNPYVLDTLARVQFVRGELTEALRIQIRAVEWAARAKNDPMGPMLRKDLAERLEEYQEAADAACTDAEDSPDSP